MELIHIKNNTFYIENRTNLGLYKINDKEVILIDSGIDKDCGKKIKKILQENNFSLKEIYNTHSHADHIGGNNYLQTEFDCKIFNMPIENEFVNNPLLEPSFLYGSLPPTQLQTKFINANKSISNEFKEDSINKDITLINLPGHTFNMCGFITKDNVAFLGDALISLEILEKHPIAYLHDINETFQTLDFLETLKADYFILSHATGTNDISSLIEVNKNAINKVIADILKICENEITFENLLQKIFYLYEINFTFMQNYIVGSTLKSYITYLLSQNKIQIIIKNNLIFYKRT